MRIWVCSIFSLVVLSCQGNDTNLSYYCPSTCFAVPGVSPGVGFSNQKSEALKEYVGQCRPGVPVCDDQNHNILECVGEVRPSSYEICDGLDNDCDGQVDEDISDRSHIVWGWAEEEKEYPCGMAGMCSESVAACVNGRWICKFPEKYEESVEVSCDGLDNDCDGRTDEDLYQDDFCFDHEDWWRATNEPCNPGVKACLDGQEVCLGQELPFYEVCDDVDNDCNGIVDDMGDVLSEDVDIVFIVDRSGSMCSYLDAVVGALDAYVLQFMNNESYKFAIVDMTNQGFSHLKIISNFTDFTEVREKIKGLSCTGSDLEASIDSIYHTCHIDNTLGLLWRDSSRKMIFAFTDERAQSRTDPPISPQEAGDACLYGRVFPFLWVDELHKESFEPITETAHGKMFDISVFWENIFDDMNLAIIGECN